MEIEALNLLQMDKRIVIKPADKGSAVVVMDRDQYIWEGNWQLMYTKYNKIFLKKPIYFETIPMVQEMLQEKKISAKQRTYDWQY